MNVHRLLAQTILASGLAVFGASSALASLVTWDFNPSQLDQGLGTPSHTYTQSGYSITATGYDNDNNGANGIDPTRNLRYVSGPPSDGATMTGLGLSGTENHELNVNPDGTAAQYIQLDLRSILAQGFTNGQIAVGSVQNGDSFRFFGSNIQGALGTQLPGSYSGLDFDDEFVSVPNFGEYQFISIASAKGGILAVAFEANMTAVPEMNALFPLLGLIAAVSSTQILRRRRAAQLNAKRL